MIFLITAGVYGGIMLYRQSFMQVKSRVSGRQSTPRKIGIGSFHWLSCCAALKVSVMLLPEEPSRILVNTGG